MNYNELVDELRENAEWAEANEWETPITLSDYLKQAADAIEELSRAQEQWIAQERNALLKSIPKWIPVTERLPELGKTVLAIDEDGEYLTPRLERLWDGEVWVGTRSVYDEQVPVTHWMPLPQPPKEE